jgi:bifunctional ADP-heptose synthase (sugar kinase/adenylyltransferase)
MALSVCAGANIMEASVIGSVVAAIAVGKMGNTPVKIDEVRKFLENL